MNLAYIIIAVIIAAWVLLLTLRVRTEIKLCRWVKSVRASDNEPDPAGVMVGHAINVRQIILAVFNIIGLVMLLFPFLAVAGAVLILLTLFLSISVGRYYLDLALLKIYNKYLDHQAKKFLKK